MFSSTAPSVCAGINPRCFLKIWRRRVAAKWDAVYLRPFMCDGNGVGSSMMHAISLLKLEDSRGMGGWGFTCRDLRAEIYR